MPRDRPRRGSGAGGSIRPAPRRRRRDARHARAGARAPGRGPQRAEGETERRRGDFRDGSEETDGVVPGLAPDDHRCGGEDEEQGPAELDHPGGALPAASRIDPAARFECAEGSAGRRDVEQQQSGEQPARAFGEEARPGREREDAACEELGPGDERDEQQGGDPIAEARREGEGGEGDELHLRADREERRTPGGRPRRGRARSTSSTLRPRPTRRDRASTARRSSPRRQLVEAASSERRTTRVRTGGWSSPQPIQRKSMPPRSWRQVSSQFGKRGPGSRWATTMRRLPSDS
jgi:hypothetical protein